MTAFPDTEKYSGLFYFVLTKNISDKKLDRVQIKTNAITTFRQQVSTPRPNKPVRQYRPPMTTFPDTEKLPLWQISDHNFSKTPASDQPTLQFLLLPVEIQKIKTGTRESENVFNTLRK